MPIPQVHNYSYLDPRYLNENQDLNYLNESLSYNSLNGKVVFASACPSCSPCSLTEYGIFISSLLLSLTGIVSVCLLSCRRSNCRSISIFGKCLKIERDNLDIDG